MRVKDFDTNGLIHAMNFVNSGTEDKELFDAAILNIIQAQGFSCIPLVDKPRVRKNLMNLVDRAVYKGNCGDVTHVSRLPIYEGEEGIITIPVDQLPIITEGEGLIPAMIKFFSSSYDSKCQLILLVGDDCKQPSAMVTMNEMKSDQVRQSLFLTLAMEGQEKKDVSFIKNGYLLNELLSHENLYPSEEELKNIENTLSLLSSVKVSDTITTGRMGTSFTLKSLKNLKIQDIMSPVAVGVIDTNLTNPKEYELAVELLSVANNFSNLITYSDTSRTIGSVVISVKTENEIFKQDRDRLVTFDINSSIFEMVKKFENNKRPLVLKPDPTISFPEGGSMKWPAIITEDVITNNLFLHHLGTIIVQTELEIKNRLKKAGIKGINISINGRIRFRPLRRATLVQLVRGEETKNHLPPGLSELIYSVNIEDEEKTIMFLRNEIFHSMLGQEKADFDIISDDNPFNASLCLKAFQAADLLKINY